MPGYSVDPNALAMTAQGITNTINELKPLGIDESAEVGRGFSNLSLTGEQAGHPDVQQPFADFCDRWSWGVRTLVQDGSQIAERLGITAGAYGDVENYLIGTLKDVAVDAGGDPHAADDQVAQESWSQLAGSLAPDYSAKSWQTAGHEMADQWLTEGRDLAEGPYGINKAVADAAGLGQQFTQAENQVFGPPPKEGQ